MNLLLRTCLLLASTAWVALAAPHNRLGEEICSHKVDDEESCYFIAHSLYNITVEKFREMNPSLRDRCNIVIGQRVSVPCTEPHQVVENRRDQCKSHASFGMDMTCDEISIYNSISVRSLKKYNHLLQENCLLPAGTMICISTMDVDFKCKLHHDVAKDDTCHDIANKYRITMRNLEDWNPDLIGRTCGIREGQRVCVEGGIKKTFTDEPLNTNWRGGPGPSETEFDKEEEHNHDRQEDNQEEEIEPDETDVDQKDNQDEETEHDKTDVDQEEKRQQASSVSHHGTTSESPSSGSESANFGKGTDSGNGPESKHVTGQKPSMSVDPSMNRISPTDDLLTDTNGPAGVTGTSKGAVTNTFKEPDIPPVDAPVITEDPATEVKARYARAIEQIFGNLTETTPLDVDHDPNLSPSQEQIDSAIRYYATPPEERHISGPHGPSTSRFISVLDELHIRPDANGKGYHRCNGPCDTIPGTSLEKRLVARSSGRSTGTRPGSSATHVQAKSAPGVAAAAARKGPNQPSVPSRGSSTAKKPDPSAAHVRAEPAPPAARKVRSRQSVPSRGSSTAKKPGPSAAHVWAKSAPSAAPKVRSRRSVPSRRRAD